MSAEQKDKFYKHYSKHLDVDRDVSVAYCIDFEDNSHYWEMKASKTVIRLHANNIDLIHFNQRLATLIEYIDEAKYAYATSKESGLTLSDKKFLSDDPYITSYFAYGFNVHWQNNIHRTDNFFLIADCSRGVRLYTRDKDTVEHYLQPIQDSLISMSAQLDAILVDKKEVERPVKYSVGGYEVG